MIINKKYKWKETEDLGIILIEIEVVNIMKEREIWNLKVIIRNSKKSIRKNTDLELFINFYENFV